MADAECMVRSGKISIIRKEVIGSFEQSLEFISHKLHVHTAGIIENKHYDGWRGDNDSFQGHVADINGMNGDRR